MHRLEVNVTGLERANGMHYAPAWMEVMVSVGLVASGFDAFALAVRLLPVLPVRGHAPACRPGAETPGGEP